MREVVTVKNLHAHKFCISSRFGYFFLDLMLMLSRFSYNQSLYV